jgi:hypothetical protein
MERFPEIYEHYQLRRKTPQTEAAWVDYVKREQLASMRLPNVTIKVLGCWDTVGSLGLPEYWLVKKLKWNDAHKFYDTELASG